MALIARRKRVVVADDGLHEVRVTIEVINRERSLTRDEHDSLTDNVTSQVMAILPGLHYLYCPLSRVRVKR
jgi:hypothetical protein